MAETLTVTVDDGGTYTVNVPTGDVALFTDANLTTPATFPTAIAADTTWYAAAPSSGRPGRRHITVYITASANGAQVVTPPLTQLPATISASEGTVAYVGPQTNGGSSAVVRKFPFAFDTPGISSGGVDAYTPTVDDILLDAWIEILTPWDGTTPLCDIGPLLDGTNQGLYRIWSFEGNSVQMSYPDDPQPGTNIVSVFNQTYGAPNLQALNETYANNAGHLPGLRWVPGRFSTSDPLKVWVTQNALSDGADPGSTQGTAVLYLVTATPVTA